MVKMTTEELAEYVLNHSIDEVISKCEKILKDYVDEAEDWEDENQSMDEILAVMIVIGATCGIIGFVFGFHIVKKYNIIYDDLKRAKETLKDIVNWFVIPLKKYSLTDEDKQHMDEATKFIDYLEKKLQ